MKLSILIATVPPRASLLSRLLSILEPQLTDEVEVLVYDGWIPFGDKVNKMREIAKGDFSVVIDDDDRVTDDYLELILPHLQNGIDYVDHGILYTVDGAYERVVFGKWPHHKCPIRNSIAKQIPLGNGYTDDEIWSETIAPRVKMIVEIRPVPYIYDFWTKGTVGTVPGNPNAENQRDVGQHRFTKERFTWL